MKIRRFTARQRHLETVRCVFGLGGGELEDGRFAGELWHEGAPDYAKSECREFAREVGANPWQIRTVLTSELYGEIATPRGWMRLAHYADSGERDCWWCGEGTGNEGDRAKCKLCEGDGYVYLGDGWREIVFAHKG